MRIWTDYKSGLFNLIDNGHLVQDEFQLPESCMSKKLPPPSAIERFVADMPAQTTLHEPPTSPALFKGYGVAVIAFAASFGLRWMLHDDLPPGFPFLTFFPAVILISFVYGTYPGVLLGILAAISSALSFIPGNAVDKILPIGFFVVISGIDIAIIGVMHTVINRVTKVQARAVAIAEERDLAVHELGHRIKNLTANFASLINFAARDADSVATLVKRVHSRLDALSAVSGVLRSGLGANTTRIGDVITLATAAVAPPRQMHIDVETLSDVVNAGDGLSISMIFHELATNAVKYGALASSSGEVRVTGARRDDGGVEIVWRETGVDPLQRKGAGKVAAVAAQAGVGNVAVQIAPSSDKGGFGTRLIERLCRALGGQAESDLTENGFHFTLTLPASRMAAASRAA